MRGSLMVNKAGLPVLTQQLLLTAFNPFVNTFTHTHLLRAQ